MSMSTLKYKKYTVEFHYTKSSKSLFLEKIKVCGPINKTLRVGGHPDFDLVGKLQKSPTLNAALRWHILDAVYDLVHGPRFELREMY